MITSFDSVLETYRKTSFSERHKGHRFERLMKAYLLTDPLYAARFQKVWLWEEFPSKKDLGGRDTGIDLISLTNDGEYWAIQCKCFDDNAYISKKDLDTFFSTSSRSFQGIDNQTKRFSHRLWISTTNNWSSNAEDVTKNQAIPFTRISLSALKNSPVNWEELHKNVDTVREELRIEIPKKKPRPHQKEAIAKAVQYYQTYDRGKLIMACGTGKTFTSLKIAEELTNREGFVLFLVPSIALLGQTLSEWSVDATQYIDAICVCSDSKVSQSRSKIDDIDMSSVVDLAYPATTDVESIMKQLNNLDSSPNKGLKVVFSTYQSIDVISKAQKELQKTNSKYAKFDVIICDEAHRTTGVSLSVDDKSNFVKVHSNDFIKADKRVYMTATPRLYDDNSKSKAEQAQAYLCSMDDESIYGKEIYRIGFGEAVSQGLLSDYKVLILTLNENNIPPSVQKAISNKENEITVDDAAKLVGCINALSKQLLQQQKILKESDPEPMKRAVAFCQTIANSKHISRNFNTTSKEYIKDLPEEMKNIHQHIQSKHIDGAMNAMERGELMDWLKEDAEDKECKILTNVRCLSEGVDVPSLDAVLFLSARNSQIDVVQSVGRVMRKSPNKKYGYIIIPLVVASAIDGATALDQNDNYKTVWTVLNALRAHDDRFESIVNKIDLNDHKPEQILVGRPDINFDEDGNAFFETDREGKSKNEAKQLAMYFGDLQKYIFAKMVEKVGDKRYWEQWAKEVASIATKQIDRITRLISLKPQHKEAFDGFLGGLHQNINPSITESEAIEMLSQHVITKPVFDALFEGYSFVENNPISQAMEKMLTILEEEAFEKDIAPLEKFYESVRKRASGIDNAEGKQKIILELYDTFFKAAFPKMVSKLGIVYTPTEVVDFIVCSVNDILQKEFGRKLSDENIHILEPFVGTGTFITRLLQSGLISKEDLLRKYTDEIHCNEIVLLAYYIAAINIENTFHDLYGSENGFVPFNGICLTDTFQLGETEASEQLFSSIFPQNSTRVEKQKKAPLRIIIGNPPYSVGQKSANDNAQNQKYTKLDARLESTYVKQTNATNKNSLYDSYIKAFRWSSDRLDKAGGIICFVTNGAWLDGNSTDGFRKSLEEEFTSIYIFNLRGNQRTSGELSRKEGGKIFGSGSRTPVSVTLLVKNPNNQSEKATIYYHDIGDYLTREDKFKLIKKFKSFGNKEMKFKILKPNDHGDWINKRNDAFDEFIELTPDKKFNTHSSSFFVINSMGVGTSRDAWVVNFSKEKLTLNVQRTINFYNSQVDDYKAIQSINKPVDVNKFINRDAKKISWSSSLIPKVEKGKHDAFKKKNINHVSYRPFNKQNLYFGSNLIHRKGQFKEIFGGDFNKIDNPLICISCTNKGLGLLITNNIADIHLNGDTQTFPLYYYEERDITQKNLFDSKDKELVRRDGVSNFILERAKKQYGNNVTKEDIFYYVYGFLHSPTYQEIFANDLKKMLPRLPLVEDVRDFWKFSRAGRELAELHINYETVEPCKETTVSYKTLPTVNQEEQEYEFYQVEKMKFPKKDKKDTIIYNSNITISNIPEKAYQYIVNGKSAIEWIMDRYRITTHKDSGITNSPNDWSKEVENPKYILNLLLSVINVSTQTVDIVDNLPKVEF